MKIIVVAAILKHHVTTPDGVTYEDWGGCMGGTLSGLSCVTCANDTIYPVARIGADNLDAYEAYIHRTWGPQFDCCGIISDPLGTNVHDAVQTGEGWITHIARQSDPVVFEDIKPFLEVGIDAVIFNCGDVRNYDPEMIRATKIQFPDVFVFVDVHWNTRDVHPDGWTFEQGWPGWRDLLPYADAVQVNRQESESLLGYRVINLEEVKTSVEEYLRAGIKTLIFTFGEHGAVIGKQPDRIEHVPAVVCPKLIDPSGAGDTFGSVFTMAMLHGHLTIRSAELGSMLASKTCGVLNYLTREDVDDQIRKIARLVHGNSV